MDRVYMQDITPNLINEEVYAELDSGYVNQLGGLIKLGEKN
jgi:hypothetical protein